MKQEGLSIHSYIETFFLKLVINLVESVLLLVQVGQSSHQNCYRLRDWSSKIS